MLFTLILFTTTRADTNYMWSKHGTHGCIYPDDMLLEVTTAMTKLVYPIHCTPAKTSASTPTSTPTLPVCNTRYRCTLGYALLDTNVSMPRELSYTDMDINDDVYERILIDIRLRTYISGIDFSNILAIRTQLTTPTRDLGCYIYQRTPADVSPSGIYVPWDAN